MLRWTERAIADLFAIGDYIELDSPGAARSWVERLRERAVRAAELPDAGRRPPQPSVLVGALSRASFARGFEADVPPSSGPGR